jgi:tetratricopeptide (TPR) repeat protein
LRRRNSNETATRLAHFAACVVKHRLNAGWSQAELGESMAEEAAALGRPIPSVPRQTISWYERGLRFPEPFYGLLLCRIFRQPPEALALDGIVTARAVLNIVASSGETSVAAIPRPPPEPPATAGLDGLSQVDWERTSTTLRSLLSVDERVVEDQWTITRQYLSGLQAIRPSSLIDLLAGHIARLRQLRAITTDQRLSRELAIMICESAIIAGQLWMGRADFGSARNAFSYAVDLSDQIGEEWLRTTGLISEAQIFGNPMPAAPRLWPPAVLKLLAEAEGPRRSGWSPQGLAWLHASRSSLHAVLGNYEAAAGALDLARRARAQAQPDADRFFAEHQDYLCIVEARLALSANPDRAVDLLDGALSRSETVPIRAWFTTLLAGAYIQAQSVELAGPTLSEALHLARMIDGPLLAHSAERMARQELALHGDHPAMKLLEDHLYDVSQPAE